MVASPSPDALAALPCVPVAARRDARYVGDHIIREYQGRHIADLCADLGLVCEHSTRIAIAGGIGRLVMTWHGNTFTPANESPTSPAPLAPVDPTVAAARIATCRACGYYRPDTDRCGLCGCGDATARRALSPVQRCPDARW